MKLLNNIEKINEDIVSINKDINKLLNEQVKTKPYNKFLLEEKLEI